MDTISTTHRQNYIHNMILNVQDFINNIRKKFEIILRKNFIKVGAEGENFEKLDLRTKF